VQRLVDVGDEVRHELERVELVAWRRALAPQHCSELVDFGDDAFPFRVDCGYWQRSKNAVRR
jgi:hypothetical protein